MRRRACAERCPPASSGAALVLTARAVRRRAAVRPGHRVRRARRGCGAAWVRLGRPRGERAAHGRRAPRARGRAGADRDHGALGAPVAPDRRASRTRCCPSPRRSRAGRRTTRIRINARFARRGRKLLAGPRVVVRDPFGLAVRPAAGRARDAELLVLPRIEPVRAIPPGGDGAGIAGAGRARAAHRRRGRPRRPAPAAPGHARFAHLLAVGRARRRDDGAPPARRVRHAPAGPARPARRGGRGGPRRGGARRGLADACTSHAPAAARCCSRASGGPVILEPTLGGWPHAHARLALVEGTMRPSLGALAGRRGPVLYVAARRLHRSPARAGERAGRRADPRRPGRAGRDGAPSFSVAGCHGYELSGARRPHAARVVADGRHRRPAAIAAPAARSATRARARRSSGSRRSRCWRPSPRRHGERTCWRRRARGRAVLMAVIAAAMGAVMLGAGRRAATRSCATAAARWRCSSRSAFMLEAVGRRRAAARARRLGRPRRRDQPGHQSLPDSTVPYLGRRPVGAHDDPRRRRRRCSLLGAAWRSGRARRPARPTPAAVALGVIYGVPRSSATSRIRCFRRGRSRAADARSCGASGSSAGRRGSRAAGRFALARRCSWRRSVDGARPLLDPQHLADPLAAKGDRSRGRTSTAR